MYFRRLPDNGASICCSMELKLSGAHGTAIVHVGGNKTSFEGRRTDVGEADVATQCI